MNTITYAVPGIHCMHCTHTIEMELAEMPGVLAVNVDLDSKNVTVTFDPPADDEKLRSLLAEIEYPVAS